MLLRARLFLATLAVCLSTTVAWAAGEIGTVSAIKGFPTATGPGGNRDLRAGSAVFEGDTIIASSGGNVQITLDDGTRLVVGAASRLVLQAYLRRNTSTASKVSVKALRGTFRFITGKSRKSAYQIETANATVGIRGTGFDLRVRDRTLAAVLEGTILLRGRNGQEVLASAGCEVAEAGRGGVSARRFDGTAKSNRLKQDFPLILNQESLRREFRLPVGNCRSSILANGQQNGGGGGPAPNPNNGENDNSGRDCQ